MGWLANNSILERCHSSATVALTAFEIIHLDYSGAMGQCRMNNDLGQGHHAYASRGRENKLTIKERDSVKKKVIDLGIYHELEPRL